GWCGARLPLLPRHVPPLQGAKREGGSAVGRAARRRPRATLRAGVSGGAPQRPSTLHGPSVTFQSPPSEVLLAHTIFLIAAKRVRLDPPRTRRTPRDSLSWSSSDQRSSLASCRQR